jgi:hypothetical protein
MPFMSGDSAFSKPLGTNSYQEYFLRLKASAILEISPSLEERLSVDGQVIPRAAKSRGCDETGKQGF